MAKYAQNTNVSSELSRLEIEKILIKYGAENFAYAIASGVAMIGFAMFERQVKFVVPLPKKEEFSLTPTGRARSENSIYEAWEQACRQRWRALKLVIQAKLEAVECGISVFEDEFMSNIVLPGGETVGEFMKPQIRDAYQLGTPPQLLPTVDMQKVKHGKWTELGRCSCCDAFSVSSGDDYCPNCGGKMDGEEQCKTKY